MKSLEFMQLHPDAVLSTFRVHLGDLKFGPVMWRVTAEGRTVELQDRPQGVLAEIHASLAA